MLDIFYKTGMQRLFSEISVAALQRFPISTRLVHFDTTSVNLFGDYRAIDGEEPPFDSTHDGILGEVALHMRTHGVEEGALIDVADSAATASE